MTCTDAKTTLPPSPLRPWAYCGLLLLAALAVYSGGWHNGFLANWDDPEYITANPDIRGVTLENLQKIFTSRYLFHYSPIHVLSHMADYALWGFEPRGFLLVNVLLHALNAILFYRILVRLGFSSAISLGAALLFTVHPVQVESVAWISQRKSVLSLAFLLGSFWQYLCYVETEQRRWRHYALALGFFLLALLTKVVVVVLPAILISYDLLLRERGRSLVKIAAEKVPFALMAAGVAWHVVTDRANPAPALVGGSVSSEVMTMLTVYQKYLHNLFWPLRLSVEYQVDIKHSIDGGVVMAALLLALAPASILLVRRERRKRAAFCLAVYLIGFLPVAQIVPFLHLMYDRYLYIPMLGFASGLAILLDDTIDRFRIPIRPVLCCSVVIFLGLTLLAWQRTRVWADSLTLWQDAVAKQPGAAKAWEGLGQSFELAGDYQQAIVSYQRALAIDPSNNEIHYKMGTALLSAAELEAAIVHFGKALELSPDDDRALYNLGYTYLLAGQYQAAIAALERGLILDPAGMDMLVFLGASHYCNGNLPAARRAYEQVRQRAAGSEFAPMATEMLALIALRQGDQGSCRRLWQEALAGGSSPVDIYLNWARLEALARQREEALRFLIEVSDRDPGALSGLSADPTFRSLHADEGFLRIVQP